MAFTLKIQRRSLGAAMGLVSVFGIVGCGTPQFQPVQLPTAQSQTPQPEAPQFQPVQLQTTRSQTPQFQPVQLPTAQSQTPQPEAPQFQPLESLTTQSQTSQPPNALQGKPQQPEPMKLKEGDVIRITFPGAPSLNTLQPVRRDGRISLPLGVGEVVAAGMTPSQLEKQLIDLFSSQLVSKEVTVTIESSFFPVFVTGAVLRPGRILADRPITALEAIMEAGGFDSRAKLKAVVVMRNVEGRMQRYTLDLERVLQGQDSATFNLKPSDIIYVPEKFSWF